MGSANPRRRVYLREVKETDLPQLFTHQQDPVANKMAAFPARDREAFMTHWRKLLDDSDVVKRTIMCDAEVAGYVACFEQASSRLIGYWLGREFWGQGVASSAVSQFISLIDVRPLYAYVAKANIGSIRVLEKCGFEVSGEAATAAPTGGEVVDEFCYVLTK